MLATTKWLPDHDDLVNLTRRGIRAVRDRASWHTRAPEGEAEVGHKQVIRATNLFLDGKLDSDDCSHWARSVLEHGLVDDERSKRVRR